MASETVTLIAANPRRKHYRKHRRNPQTTKVLGLGFEWPRMQEFTGGLVGIGAQSLVPTFISTFTSRLPFLSGLGGKGKSIADVVLSAVALGAGAHFMKKQLGAMRGPAIVGIGGVAGFQLLHVLTDGKAGIPPTMQFVSLPKWNGTKGLPAPVGAIPPSVPTLGGPALGTGAIAPQSDVLKMPEL